MKRIIFSALIVAAALMQSTLINGIRIFGVKPDLLWIMVMAAALYFDLSAAVVFAVLSGLLKDSLGTSTFGVFIVLLPLWTVVVRSLSKRISFDYLPVSSVFLAVMIFVNAIIIRSIPPAVNVQLSFMAFLRISVIESLYTAFVFVWIGPWLRRVAVSTLW
jgi:rod shape-determining protein MreD